MDFVEVDVNTRSLTGAKSPSVLSVSVAGLLEHQKIHTPVSNGLCTRSDYGVNPIMVVPAFAEAYNMLANPHLVKLELSQEDEGFNIERVTAHLMRAANTGLKNEKEINKGIWVVLRELFDFLDVRLHHAVPDKNNAMATEIDWLAFCRTPHGWLCLPFSGEGKRKRGARGDSVLQNFFALQCLLAIDPVRKQPSNPLKLA